MSFKDVVLALLFLASTISAIEQHEPQVHEDLPDDMPEVVRTARHSDGSQKVFQPPTFNYRTARQQDLMRVKYHQQQRTDFRRFQMKKAQYDVPKLNKYPTQNRGTPMSISFGDSDSDWKPIQPKYLSPIKPKNRIEIEGRRGFVVSKTHPKDNAHENHTEADLDISGSETKENKVNTDRNDGKSQFIYVQPNNFGLGGDTTRQILQDSAPNPQGTDELQLSELRELLGKNPEDQLEGLQKLLEGTSASPAAVAINHNGSPALPSDQPSFEDLQQQIDAINKAHADAALEAAQKQAEAHVKAQHQAIALAQEKAQAAAFAKIAAHNQGASPIGSDVPNNFGPSTGAPILFSSPTPSQYDPVEDAGEARIQTLALKQRPYEEILLQSSHRDDAGYTYHSDDLRNSKPIINNNPVSISYPSSAHTTQYPKIHPVTISPQIYASGPLHITIPVSKEVQQTKPSDEVGLVTPLQPFASSTVEPKRESYQETKIESTDKINQLYSGKATRKLNDLQYAARYAFGYRILDEDHGNDFGHQEQRDDKLTKGHYFVRLPDGRRQQVDYFVDNSGYHARVSYDDVGRHLRHTHKDQQRKI